MHERNSLFRKRIRNLKPTKCTPAVKEGSELSSTLIKMPVTHFRRTYGSFKDAHTDLANIFVSFCGIKKHLDGCVSAENKICWNQPIALIFQIQCKNN